MKHEFDTQLLITVAGVEEEYDLHVTGEYHRAQEAFTYAGEHAPTDPPEPASFEIHDAKCEVKNVIFQLVPLLSAKQSEAIEAEGLRDAQENG